MDRILFHDFLGIRGFDVAWYGFLTAMGILAGLLPACLIAHRRGRSVELIVEALLFGVPMSFVGARLYYVIFRWDYYGKRPEEIFHIEGGGQAFYGSLIGGTAGILLFCLWKKVRPLFLLDILFSGMLMGQMVGRWGNFINQEAYGKLITQPQLQFFPYGVWIESLGEWHQATFFYEFAWNTLLLVLILAKEKKLRREGQITALYCMGYGLGRFWIEGLREDSLYFGSFRVSQLVSLILAAAGFLLWRWSLRRKLPAACEGDRQGGLERYKYPLK